MNADALSVAAWLDEQASLGDRGVLGLARQDKVAWRDLRRFYNRWCWARVNDWPEPDRTNAFHRREGRSLPALQGGDKGWLLARSG